jgi:hypothetical protein
LSPQLRGFEAAFRQVARAGEGHERMGGGTYPISGRKENPSDKRMGVKPPFAMTARKHRRGKGAFSSFRRVRKLLDRRAHIHALRG